jgi:hypothetical protein
MSKGLQRGEDDCERAEPRDEPDGAEQHGGSISARRYGLAVVSWSELSQSPPLPAWLLALHTSALSGKGQPRGADFAEFRPSWQDSPPHHRPQAETAAGTRPRRGPVTQRGRGPGLLADP